MGATDALPAPEAGDLGRIVVRIHERFVRWLGRRGLLADPDVAAWSQASAERTSLDACLEGALGIGQLGAVHSRDIVEGSAAPPGSEDERFGRLRRGPHVADAFGWSLHAGSTVLDSDRDALERLLRYFTRPPLAQHRLALLRDGRVAYALRKPWRRGQTHRIMSPLQLIARLAALIPAPRHPLLRFHGAFAPHSSWRKAVVPLTPPRPRAPPWQCPQPAAAADASGASPDGTHQNGGADSVPARGGSSATSVTSDTRARLSRIDWATLLWRVYDVDALACSCGTRLRFVALFTDRAWAGTALDALGLGDRDSDGGDADSDPAAPQIRARDPTIYDAPTASP